MQYGRGKKSDDMLSKTPSAERGNQTPVRPKQQGKTRTTMLRRLSFLLILDNSKKLYNTKDG